MSAYFFFFLLFVSSVSTVQSLLSTISYTRYLSPQDVKAVAQLLSETFDSSNFLLKWYSRWEFEVQLQERIEKLINRFI